MASTVVELLLLGVVAYGTAMVVRSMNRRRAARRRAELTESGSSRFPCRLSWGAGIGRKSFVYGNILVNAQEGLMFSSRKGIEVALPKSEWVHREMSWRSGLVILHYSVPEKGDVRILLSEEDAETVDGILRATGPQ